MHNDEERRVNNTVEELNCRWNRKMLVSYLSFLSPYMVNSTISLILLRQWIGIKSFIIVYSVFLPIFFVILRPLVHCSHCPYYNEKKFLEPLPKIWKFSFRPMNTFEKISYLIGLGFFLIFPLIAQTIGLNALIKQPETNPLWKILIFSSLMFLSISFSFFFIISLYTKLCIRCIHFSCPLNRISTERKNLFIDKNPEYEIFRK